MAKINAYKQQELVRAFKEERAADGTRTRTEFLLRSDRVLLERKTSWFKNPSGGLPAMLRVDYGWKKIQKLNGTETVRHFEVFFSQRGFKVVLPKVGGANGGGGNGGPIHGLLEAYETASKQPMASASPRMIPPSGDNLAYARSLIGSKRNMLATANSQAELATTRA